MEMAKKGRILAVGAAYEDLFLYVERDGAWGESLPGKGYAYCFGGKSANQAVAASRLGAEVSFLGVVGDDGRGKRIAANLAEQGVETSGIRVAGDVGSGLAVVIVDAQGKNKNYVFKEAAERLRNEDVDAMLEQPFGAVLLSLEAKLETVAHTLRRARGKNIPAFVDAGPIVACDIRKLGPMTILSPNETEAEALCGVRVDGAGQAKRAAERLRELSGAEIVVLKMGERGAYLLSDTAHGHFPANKVKAKDTTGAGDVFSAAFLIRYMRDKDAAAATRYANEMAGLCVEAEGSQPSFPDMRAAR